MYERLKSVSRITPDEVRELALLARLALSEQEVARMTGDLGAILTYVDALRELDTTGVEADDPRRPVRLPAA